MMVALVNAISKKRGKKPIEKVGCENCPARESCETANNEKGADEQ